MSKIRMRVALIAPPWFEVPPPGYGNHAAHQPQPRAIPHPPRLRRHPRRRQLPGGPRRDRGDRAGQRPARHDPRARPASASSSTAGPHGAAISSAR